MIGDLHKVFWFSESAVNLEMGDAYMSEMPLASSAWALTSTLKSCINSGNKISPYFNTKYYCAKNSQNKNIIKIVLDIFLNQCC